MHRSPDVQYVSKGKGGDLGKVGKTDRAIFHRNLEVKWGTNLPITALHDGSPVDNSSLKKTMAP